MAHKNCITISRQFGCGGAKIGHRVASELGFYYADRTVLHYVAKSLGGPSEETVGQKEGLEAFGEKITAFFSHGRKDAPYAAPALQMATDEHLFALEGRIIKELADREDCVVVGRAGVHVLRDHPGSVHVFLHAPEKFRTKNVMDVYGVPTEEKALAMIRESDRARQAYLSRMANYDWFYVTNYHLCLDTSTVSFEQAASLIIAYFQLKTGRLASISTGSAPKGNKPAFRG